MNVSEFLTNLTDQGIQLWAEQDKLRINAPKGAVNSQLQADIKAYKTEILAFLRKNNDSSCQTDSGLSLQTIGRLIGGFCESSPLQFKSPVIDPKLMAKKVKVTFRPLPKGFKNKTVVEFRKQLEAKLHDLGVQIIPWEEATREISYTIKLPLFNQKKNLKMKVVKTDVNAVIDVERSASGLVDKLKSLVAENIYQLYSRFISKEENLSVAKIAQLISWAEDHAIQRLEDPTSTQVILLKELDENWKTSEIPYQSKIAIGVNTLVKTFSEIVISVSEQEISILNMNLCDSIFPRENFENFVFKSLIPKIYVPIAPLSMSRFKVGKYNSKESVYAAKLVELSSKLSTTELFPSGFKLSEIIKRQSHRDIVDSIIKGRSGVSYGFVAYAEPPQYVGDREIDATQWENLSSVEGFSSEEVRQNEIGRRYIKTKINEIYFYKQIPDIWLVSSRSGANKTDLNIEYDILRMGLKNNLCLEIPEGIDPSKVDIKPSFDTYVMMAMALAAALYVPELISEGAPMIHFHGYPSRDWFEADEYYTGVENASVPCGTYESGVFNFLGIYNIARQMHPQVSLIGLVEPDHGTNIMTNDLDYLLARLKTGIELGKIELGGKYFASLSEKMLIN